MPDPPMLDSQWESRDRPALLEIARQLALSSAPFDVRELENRTDTGLHSQDFVDAAVALHPTYVEGKAVNASGHGAVAFIAKAITDRGRREVGLWPREEDAAGALIELLDQAADTAPDEDDAGALRKAGRLLRTVPGAVLADVTAALIRQQTGIG